MIAKQVGQPCEIICVSTFKRFNMEFWESSRQLGRQKLHQLTIFE